MAEPSKALANALLWKDAGAKHGYVVFPCPSEGGDSREGVDAVVGDDDCDDGDSDDDDFVSVERGGGRVCVAAAGSSKVCVAAAGSSKRCVWRQRGHRRGPDIPAQVPKNKSFNYACASLLLARNTATAIAH